MITLLLIVRSIYTLHHRAGKLDKVLEEKKERTLLDVGCGGGQSAIRLKGSIPTFN